MNVLADTNIILDVLLKREPYFTASYAFLDLAVQDKLTILITASCVTDVYYLLRKGGLSDSSCRQALHQLLAFTQLADVRPDDIQNALVSSVHDFEDAVVIEVAKRNKCSAIVTRNVKDFTDSSITVYDPDEFLKTHFSD